MPAQENSLKPYYEVVAGSIIYGTIGIFLNKIQDMSAGSILFFRLFFGFCIIFIYLLFNQRLAQLKPKNKKIYLLFLGLLNTITGTCYFLSIRYSGVSVAVLLLYTAPVYVNLFAPSILGERRNSNGLLPLLLAISGVLLIARPENVLANTGPDFQKGIAFGLLSGLSFSATIITIRYLSDDYTGIAQTFWLTGISLIFLLPSALSTPTTAFTKNFNILFLFSLTITFAAVIYLRGIASISAQTGSILALVEPVSGIFFDIAVLKNPLYVSTFLGCIFILVAAYIISKRDEMKSEIK
jgi:drug/metabolite transporter (DMT)-like permease